jgi:hypothetical protein
MRILVSLAAATALVTLASTRHSGWTAAAPHGVSRGTPRAARMPFHVGEKLSYQAKVNFLSAGSASMNVEDIEEIRGHATYHTVFDVHGHVLFFHVDDHYESWFDTTTLISLHHTQHIDEGRRHDDNTYDFYPEHRDYVRNGQEKPGVADPLDEGSFIYFLRSLTLEVGKTYTLNRYYDLSRNPITIQVERREHVTVPAGDFDAIVVHPVIKSRGLFSERGDAEVWLTDDSAHTLVRLKSKLPFGTLYLELKQAEYASQG